MSCVCVRAWSPTTFACNGHVWHVEQWQCARLNIASGCKGQGKKCHSRSGCRLIQQEKEGKKGVGHRAGFLILLSCGSVMQAVFMK